MASPPRALNLFKSRFDLRGLHSIVPESGDEPISRNMDNVAAVTTFVDHDRDRVVAWSRGAAITITKVRIGVQALLNGIRFDELNNLDECLGARAVLDLMGITFDFPSGPQTKKSVTDSSKPWSPSSAP